MWPKCGHENAGTIDRMDPDTDWRQRMPPKSRLHDVPHESKVARMRRENDEWASKCGPVTVRKIGEPKT